MKRQDAIGWQGAKTSILIITGVLLTPIYCQVPNVALLLKQNLIQGGTIIPGPGVHDFAPNSEVTLTAIPKPGYYFVCWLGDVADPTSSTTFAILNKPKIIIAVFEQNEYDTLTQGAGAPGSSHSGGGSSGGGSSGGGSSGGGSDYSPPPDNPPQNPPVIPTPEPAIGLLLALGTLALLRRRSA